MELDRVYSDVEHGAQGEVPDVAFEQSVRRVPEERTEFVFDVYDLCGCRRYEHVAVPDCTEVCRLDDEEVVGGV